MKNPKEIKKTYPRRCGYAKEILIKLVYRPIRLYENEDETAHSE